MRKLPVFKSDDFCDGVSSLGVEETGSIFLTLFFLADFLLVGETGSACDFSAYSYFNLLIAFNALTDGYKKSSLKSAYSTSPSMSRFLIAIGLIQGSLNTFLSTSLC